MAPGQKLYPRATVKKIVKAHSGCNLSKNVDVMVGVFLTRRYSLLMAYFADISGLCPLHANVSLYNIATP